MRKRTNSHSRGFTLLELMVTMAIIGVIMAIALANYINYRNKGFCNLAETDAKNVQGALADHFAISTHTAIPAPGDLDAATVNEYIITGDTNDVISITVSDGSKRCPDSYKQANDGWDVLTKTYTLTID